MKKLGVIGGLGPMATAYFFQLVTQMSYAECDQEHMETIIYSKPNIADRTKYILNRNEKNPVGDIIEVGNILKASGADVIAIPCITAHFFHSEIEDALKLPIIHGIEETAVYLKSRNKAKIGIMATDGTIQSELFQKTFQNYGLQSVLPDEENQKKVMSIIYDNVKAGKAVDMDNFKEISAYLFGQGAEVIILACTELSIVKRDYKLPAGYLDVLEVLALNAVKQCGNVREEYLELITKEEGEK